MGRVLARASQLLVLVLILGLLQTLPAEAARPRRPHPHRKPWPITLTVRTVPPLPGVRMTVDGVALVTDAHGEVAFTQEHNFRPHQLLLLDVVVKRGNRQYRFVRWAGQRDPDQAFRRVVTGLPMRANYTVSAAFAVQLPVTFRFVDLQGTTVPVQRITRARLRTSTGGTLGVPLTGPLWLEALVPEYRSSQIDLKPATYALADVMVGGSNTVDANQQRFQPATSPAVVTFVTKFYDLTVRSHDLLLRHPTGRGAVVTCPDGSRRAVTFGPSGTGTLTNLPRGRYTVELTGSGTAIPRQVMLSRSATVDLAVATQGTYGLIGTTILVIVLGLLLLGRAPFLLRLARRLVSVGGRRPPRATQEAQG
jgi:hypothetical protein